MDLDLLEERIGHAFADRDLLREALTHTTYVNEHREEAARDNQRLEFLGDSVINAVITVILFEQFPLDKEGRLTKKRAELINEGALFRIARHLLLGDFLMLGKGEEMDGGRMKPSLLADAYEAVIGAVFMDGGFERASSVTRRHFEDVFGAFEGISSTDYKSLLLEYCQVHYRELPRLSVTCERGPEHDKEFEVAVSLAGEIVGRGVGRNKKQASQEACREALRSLGHNL
jgi:ribonuclease-3